ncbi:hypothetical protein V7S43_010540 [Phytophthora oleae]|uniref:Uncharacterized protein n=1 Tax=Phytophthora oleae TaxID=2107226 RepID=A0ABD3FES9_9STRA
MECASSSGHSDVAAFLLENGGWIDKHDVNGDTALYIASRNGPIETERLLIEKDACVEVASNDGNSVHMAASQLDHSAVAGALIEVEGSTISAEPRNSVTRHLLTRLRNILTGEEWRCFWKRGRKLQTKDRNEPLLPEYA